jgi:hypothetical protein
LVRGASINHLVNHLSCSSVTHRYNGPNSYRILSAKSENYLSGFWNPSFWGGDPDAGCPGVAHHNGWMGESFNISACLPLTSWVLSTDQMLWYRAQRGLVNYTTGGSRLDANSTAQWTINNGLYVESSEWACAGLLHYDRELSLAEIELVEGWMDGLFMVVPAPL